jgi:hypothetical protein
MQFVHAAESAADSDVLSRKRPMTPVCIPTQKADPASDLSLQNSRDTNFQIEVRTPIVVLWRGAVACRVPCSAFTQLAP